MIQLFFGVFFVFVCLNNGEVAGKTKKQMTFFFFFLVQEAEAVRT